MNLMGIFNEKEIQLLNEAGVVLENREYNDGELKQFECNIMNFIMNHSSKNGDISKLNLEYDSILRVISKWENWCNILQKDYCITDFY